MAQGNPSPSASLRLDLAGAELVYDGPSGVHDNTSVIASVRQFDFGRLFDLIGENDIGSPVMTDFILKTHTQVDAGNAMEFLVLHTPERLSRDVEHVLQSENLEDRELLETNQDSTLVGATWTRLLGNAGRWENRVFYRDSAKTSIEGEASHASTPTQLPAERVPIRRNILTLAEQEREFGWRSDLAVANRWGVLAAGWRLSDLDIGFGTTLAGPWARFAFDGGDSRPSDAERFIVLTPEATKPTFAHGARQHAAYAEQMFDAGDWTLRAGLRHEYDGFSAGQAPGRLHRPRRRAGRDRRPAPLRARVHQQQRQALGRFPHPEHAPRLPTAHRPRGRDRLSRCPERLRRGPQRTSRSSTRQREIWRWRKTATCSR